MDVCGRLGGEEFAILMPDASLDQALDLTAQLTLALASMQVAGARGITASLGLAAADGEDGDLHCLLNRADQALYRAKAQGRNRVCVAQA